MSEVVYGILLSFAASILFAGNGIATRRGVLTGHIFINAFVSIIIGIPIYLIYIIITGEWIIFKSINANIILLFTIVGILHFLIGRVLLYGSIHYIGAVASYPIISISSILAAFIAIPLLNETYTYYKICGLIIVTIGVYIISKKFIQVKVYRIGLYLAIASSLVFASTSLIIRYALIDFSFPVIGVFISYFSVFPIYLLLSKLRYINIDFSSVDKTILKYIIYASIFVDAAQLFRYMSLYLIEVSLMGPILATSPILTMILSYMFNRDIEFIDKNIVVAVILVFMGMTIVTLESL